LDHVLRGATLYLLVILVECNFSYRSFGCCCWRAVRFTKFLV